MKVDLSKSNASVGGLFSDNLVAIENVTGSNFGDLLTGNAVPNTISGGGGNDSIDIRDGIGGNDLADGGVGTDKCLADAGDKKISCEL